MDDAERKLLYIDCQFTVLGRAVPLNDGRIDLDRARGILSTYVYQGVIPPFKDWEYEAFGPSEDEEEPYSWPAQADISLYKALNRKVI